MLTCSHVNVCLDFVLNVLQSFAAAVNFSIIIDDFYHAL